MDWPPPPPACRRRRWPVQRRPAATATTGPPGLGDPLTTLCGRWGAAAGHSAKDGPFEHDERRSAAKRPKWDQLLCGNTGGWAAAAQSELASDASPSPAAARPGCPRPPAMLKHCQLGLLKLLAAAVLPLQAEWRARPHRARKNSLLADCKG